MTRITRTEVTRRRWIQGNLALLGGAAAASAMPLCRAATARDGPDDSGGKRGMKLALAIRPDQHVRKRIARQIGVNQVITSVRDQLAGAPLRRYLDILASAKKDFEQAGLTIAGLESNQTEMRRIKLGLPGRDEDLQKYCHVLKCMGELGIPLLCYNFMVQIGWYRTAVDVPARGGALTSRFDYRAAKAQPLTEAGRISQQQVWEHYTYFIRHVMPAAEAARVQMALHPDDPPISPLRGIGRIFINADGFRRAMKLAPSPFNGVTFCQANFKAMGEDVKALVREFASQRKLFFVHFRDICGTAECFRETFHDNGPTNMPEMLKLYHEVGFDGPIRPDHAPVLEGESNESPGYAIQGKIFAIGYMKGILDALDIPYR